MSPALVIGHPTTLVASVILIPVILAIAIFLPGNQFLPLASLAGMFYLFPMILPFTRGNVVKTLIIGLVTLVIGLYFVTDMAPDFTLAANQVYAATGDNAAHILDGFSGGALRFRILSSGWGYLSRCEAFIRRYGIVLAVITVAMMVINRSAHREGREKKSKKGKNKTKIIMKKLTLILATMVLTASRGFLVSGKCGYEVKAEEMPTLTATFVMQAIRWMQSTIQQTAFAVNSLSRRCLLRRGKLDAYTMFDRFLSVVLSQQLLTKLTSIAPLSIQTSQTDRENLLDNRELGTVNIGGEELLTVTVDGKKYTLGFQEGSLQVVVPKNIEVSSKDAAKPAKFYMNSACAHQTYPTKKVT